MKFYILLIIFIISNNIFGLDIFNETSHHMIVIDDDMEVHDLLPHKLLIVSSLKDLYIYFGDQFLKIIKNGTVSMPFNLLLQINPKTISISFFEKCCKESSDKINDQNQRKSICLNNNSTNEIYWVL